MGSLHEEEDTSSSAKSSRLLRLEHILGGKSRRGGTLAEDGKLEKETKSLNSNERAAINETMLEASTNSCVGDFVQCEDLGLEIAMKQLMEATHDALVNMKGEILRMQYDLERALVEISLLQQREELLQQQFKGKALELENEFSKRLEDLRQTVLLEFTMCKHEQRSRQRAALTQQRAALTQQRAALTEEMLQRISPKRFEQSVAVVRGWLQSPTPSEVSFAPIADHKGKASTVKQQRLCNVLMPNLVASVKEEAKLSATHRLVFTPTQTKVPELPTECRGMRSDFHHQHAAELITDVTSEQCLTSTTPSVPLQPAVKKAQYKENVTEDCQPPTKPFALAAFPHHKKEVPASRAEQPVTHEGRPALRILKPKNFRISDLLVSDSEEELGSSCTKIQS